MNNVEERFQGSQKYMLVQEDNYPKRDWEKFKQVISRSFKGELFVGLKITFKMMKEALFNKQMHTVQYPAEKLPMSPRFRAMHKLLRLLESGSDRCIGCGLCEQICISNCIRMDTKIDENSRKEVLDYSINLGRCIFCGYCAEVCPELAIVHHSNFPVNLQPAVVDKSWTTKVKSVSCISKVYWILPPVAATVPRGN